eukprot:GHVT01019310.1.p1 GENE.GHVT01019310.1~~GHVT01019310.1.p1  ORF type:complete len:613 (+),score=115.60 GHVT01019310.1:85-1839(+)
MCAAYSGQVFVDHDALGAPPSAEFSSEFSQESSGFPKLKECALFFKRYLMSGDSSLGHNLILTDYTEGKKDHVLVEMDLFQLVQFQNTKLCQEVLACDSPRCSNPKHLAPIDFAERLARAMLERPLAYLPTCERVATEWAKRRGMMPSTWSASAVQLSLIHSAFPTTAIRELKAIKQEKFVVLPGIVVQASRPSARFNAMRIQCRFCQHTMTLNVPVWREAPQIPKYCRHATTALTVRGQQSDGSAGEMPSCKGVPFPYKIISIGSEYVDVQHVKLQELPEDVPTGDTPRHIQVNATRFLCQRMKPGDRVVLHGVLTCKGRVQDAAEGSSYSYLHLLGLRKFGAGRTEAIQFSGEEEAYFQQLRQDPGIHSKLFSSIAPAIFGMEDVKKAIACLLFGGTTKCVANDKSKLRGDIHVLLLGDPSVAKSQILKFVDRVAPICVYTSGKGSSAAGLTAAVIRDRQGVFALEGGAMVLADGGVCCIDEFDKMREDDVVAIHEAMEQQTISISKAGITTMLNTRCSVVAAANPTFGSFDDTQDTTEQHEFKTTILSRFDMIFLLRDVHDYARDERLCKHILSLHGVSHR